MSMTAPSLPPRRGLSRDTASVEIQAAISEANDLLIRANKLLAAAWIAARQLAEHETRGAA